MDRFYQKVDTTGECWTWLAGKDRDVKGRNGYRKRTHCPNGHAYSVENTASSNGWRKCRACKKAYDAKRNAA